MQCSLFASLSPYFVPFIGGIGTYVASRTLDTKKRVKVREKRRMEEMNNPKTEPVDTSVETEESKAEKKQP